MIDQVEKYRIQMVVIIAYMIARKAVICHQYYAIYLGACRLSPFKCEQVWVSPATVRLWSSISWINRMPGESTAVHND